jgi:hypothetical protein
MGFIVLVAAFELGALRVYERGGSALGSDAVPDLLDKIQALVHSKPVDSQRFHPRAQRLPPASIIFQSPKSEFAQ